MRLLVVVTLLALFAGCPRERPPAVEVISIAMHLRPRPSCDLTPVQYLTDCLAAFELIIEPTDSVTPAQRFCEVLEPQKRPATLGDIIAGDEPIIRFGTMTGRGALRFKVRGIHDLALPDGVGACDQSVGTNHLLFWGESPPVTLETDADDAGVVEVTVPLDCRDCPGGCENIGTTQCPAGMPPSFCVPYAAGFSCERRCEDDGDCFEGSLSCDDESERCDPASGDPLTGDSLFCAECDVSSDCHPDFTCVSSPGAPRGLCTRSCPDVACYSGATCRRRGAALVVRSGPTGSDDDGGVIEAGAP